MNRMMPIAAATALLALVVSAPAAADDYYWNNPDEGGFCDADNWNDGESGVPGSGDVAIFDIESYYSVVFAADHATDRALIRSGDVWFKSLSPEITFTYTLLNENTATPGLVIGRGGRDIVWLTLSNISLHATNMTIGHLPDGTGHVMQDFDSDGSLLIDQNLIVGNEGLGTMEMADMDITSAAGKIGLAASGRGDVTLRGSEMQWTCDGPLTVGMSGEGTLTLSNDAAVSSHDAIIAQHEDSAGAVTLSGHSQWSIDGTLDVGMSGFGTLEIGYGATVTNHTFATIGTYDSWPEGNGGVGEVVVESGSWTIDGDLYIGFFGAGSLALEGQLSSAAVSGDVSIGLSDTGTLILSRGAAITIGGNLTNYDHDFDEIIITVRYGDDYLTPAIDAGGTIDSFQPEIILHYSYQPQAGDTFAIAHADGGLGEFSFILPELPPGLDWEVIQDDHDVMLMVVEAPEGDINGDGLVNTADLLLLLGAWGECPGCPEDINGDGVVNTADLLILLGDWSG